MNQTITLLTEKDVMQSLQVSRTTLWRLRESGDLLPIKVGRSVRYRLADIEAYLQSLAPEEPAA